MRVESEFLHTVRHANVFHVQYLQARSGLAVRVVRSKFRAPDDVMSSVYYIIVFDNSGIFVCCVCCCRYSSSGYDYYYYVYRICYLGKKVYTNWIFFLFFYLLIQWMSFLIFFFLIFFYFYFIAIYIYKIHTSILKNKLNPSDSVFIYFYF